MFHYDYKQYTTNIISFNYFCNMLKKQLQLLFQLLFLFLTICCFIWNSLVLYGIAQAKGQLSIVLNAQPIIEVLKDNNFPDSLKQKLVLIVEIKQFAIDSLGINSSNNYSTVYNQDHKPVLLTISACEPFALKPKEWHFPVLGNVPYKGFFNIDKAKKEINELIYKGYDVDVYSPSGWSTLGWFNDPILSNMLYRSEGQLANLIIHELTHGTIFIKNNVEFNENLANFIGDKGAEQFLIYKFGKNSKEFINYEQSKEDEKLYNEYILKNVQRLDSLYKSTIIETSVIVKKEKKKKIISEIVRGVNKLDLYKKENYFKFSLQAFSEKNAFFMSFQRYDSQYDVFEKEYKLKYKSNLHDYLNHLKKIYRSI